MSGFRNLFFITTCLSLRFSSSNSRPIVEWCKTALIVMFQPLRWFAAKSPCFLGTEGNFWRNFPQTKNGCCLMEILFCYIFVSLDIMMGLNTQITTWRSKNKADLLTLEGRIRKKKLTNNVNKIWFQNRIPLSLGYCYELVNQTNRNWIRMLQFFKCLS